MKKKISAILAVVIMAVSLVMPQDVSAAAKLGQVKGVKCTQTTAKSISITWNQLKGVSNYQIYRSDSYDGRYVKMFTAHQNYKNVAKINPGTEYYYKVRAVKGKNTGKFSKVLSASTKRTTAKNGKVNTKKWNAVVRSHAGTNHSKVASLPKGTKVTVIANTKDKKGQTWYKISYKVKGKSAKGYTIASNLKVY